MSASRPLEVEGGWRPGHPGVTLVLGLGNQLLGDDGIGWLVARRVADEMAARDEVEVDWVALGGLRLMERLVGYERAVLVDAASTGETGPGVVRTLTLDELPERSAGRLGSPHDMSLAAALALGRSLGAPLPERPLVVTVEAEPALEVGEGLSPLVAAALPRATEAVLRLVRGDSPASDSHSEIPARPVEARVGNT